MTRLFDEANSMAGILISRFLLNLRQVCAHNYSPAGRGNSSITSRFSNIRFATSVSMSTDDLGEMLDLEETGPLAQVEQTDTGYHQLAQRVTRYQSCVNIYRNVLKIVLPHIAIYPSPKNTGLLRLLPPFTRRGDLSTVPSDVEK